MRKSFDTFKDLPDGLQKEAIREGEMMLSAQLQTASAADQRALTWSGFLITAATAALGGGIALLTKSPSDPVLAAVAIVFAGLMLRAAWLAVSTVAPSLFCFPGNNPKNWLPEEWNSKGAADEVQERARTEQAKLLSESIDDNAKDARKRARIMNVSFKLAFRAVGVAGVMLLLVLAVRQLPSGDAIIESIAGPAEGPT